LQHRGDGLFGEHHQPGHVVPCPAHTVPDLPGIPLVHVAHPGAVPVREVTSVSNLGELGRVAHRTASE